MVRNLPLVGDLAQDAFVQLDRKLAFSRGDSAFTTWLHRITVNTVLIHLRKRVLPVVSLDEMMTDVPEERAGREFGMCDLAQAGRGGSAGSQTCHRCPRTRLSVRLHPPRRGRL